MLMLDQMNLRENQSAPSKVTLVTTHQLGVAPE